MPVCPDCGTLFPPNGGGHCRECHQTFANDRTGDAHRVGPFEPRGVRRCLSVAEMLGMEWRLVYRGWTMYEAMTAEEKARAKARRAP